MNLPRIFRRNKLPQTKHPTEFAFRARGVDYYRFANDTKLPCMRAFHAMLISEELRSRTSRAYLEDMCKAGMNLSDTNRQQIPLSDLNKINQLFGQLKERLDWVVEPETLYKMASVVFFDANENVEEYDWDYNKAKIERWKKEPVNAFFLQMPLQELMGFLNGYSINFLSYFQATESLTKAHLEAIYTSLSVEQREGFTARHLISSVKATPQS